MTLNKTKKIILCLLLLTGLTACSTTRDRLANVGKDPAMAPVENPVQRAGYQSVSMPMPKARTEVQQANSLWMSGRKSFFKDQRATQIGDILTVLVDMKDTARLQNRSEKTKNSADNMQVPGLFGLETQLTKVLPEGTIGDNLIGVGSTTRNIGRGTIQRDEEIELKVAAVVTQVLPNGNMVIHGRQQVRVSNERRDLEVAGVIRPEDITIGNSIPYEKIAEARIAYGGQGMLTDANRPRYGSEVLDIILPF